MSRVAVSVTKAASKCAAVLLAWAVVGGLVAGCAGTRIKRLSGVEFVTQANQIGQMNSFSWTCYVGSSHERTYLEFGSPAIFGKGARTTVYWALLSELPDGLAAKLKDGKPPWQPWQPVKNWKSAGRGLVGDIILGATAVRTGERVPATFVVTNTTSKTVSVPVPDVGTLAFYVVAAGARRDASGGDGLAALAGNPGRRDLWRDLAPGASLRFVFSYTWRQAGVYGAYCKYCTRSTDRPFATLETPRVRVVVTESRVATPSTP